MSVNLCDVRVDEEQSVGAAQKDANVSFDVDVDDSLVGLSFVGGVGDQGDLDGVRECCENGVGCGVCEGDDDVEILGGGIFLGVGDDKGAVGCRLKSVCGLRVGLGEWLNRG